MSCTHSHTNTKSKSGPARMATTQDEFRRVLAVRFRALRGALRKTVVEHDALDLPADQSNGPPDDPRALLNADAPDIDAATSFKFETGGRVAAFQEWWRDAIERGFLQPVDSERVVAGEHYSATHVDKAYQRGVRWANARAREARSIRPDESDPVVVMRRPVHRQTLRTLYTRTYGELESVAERAETQVARILSEGVASGEQSRRIGDQLANEVRTIQRTNGRMVARTEVMNAFSNGTGQRYREFDIERARIVTLDPCPQCAAIADDGPYPVDEAARILPIHPNCMCALAPAPQSDRSNAALAIDGRARPAGPSP